MFFDEKIRKTKKKQKQNQQEMFQRAAFAAAVLSLSFFLKILCGPESHVKFGGSMSRLKL